MANVFYVGYSYLAGHRYNDLYSLRNKA